MIVSFSTCRRGWSHFDLDVDPAWLADKAPIARLLAETGDHRFDCRVMIWEDVR